VNNLPEARPSSAPQSWEKTFPNSIPALMGAIDSMCEFLTLHSAGPKALYNMQLTVEELCVNIIKHGYRDQQEHCIKLFVESLPGCFRLQLIDDAMPFDIRQAQQPDPSQSLEEREPGGWGIGLVRGVAQRIDYERRNNLNVLTVEIARD
jgi:anti-sigma regulatory factor (Ser/Thr protein kinase)